VADKLQELAERDGRYSLEAYLFVYESLTVAQKLFGRERHVSGKELLEGIKKLARERYGRMAKSVLNNWGVRATDDFGQIVFNLVNSDLLSKTDEDKLEDFHAVYDFEEEFISKYTIGTESSQESKAKSQESKLEGG